MYNYLFGYQRSSKSQDEYETLLECKSYPQKRHLYFPPSFDSYGPSDRHGATDDLYALGVTLLEIGLWQSFLKRQDETYVVDEDIFSAEDRATPQNMHAKFMQLAEKRLPCTVGFEYSQIVIDFLKSTQAIHYDRTTTAHKFEEEIEKRMRSLAEKDPLVRQR